MRTGIVCAIGVLARMFAAERAAAACGSTDACLRAVEQAQRGTRTLAAEFVQVKHLSLLDEPLVSSGHFVFKRPDRLLLTIEQPQPASLVINGQNVQIPNLPARERDALGNLPIATLFTKLGAILAGSTQALRDRFDVTASEDDGAIRMKLVPRESTWKPVFQTIEIVFAGSDLLAQQIRLENTLGDSLDITLRHVQRNIDVPDSTFKPATQ